jgi:MYXO-CTERM domain-containing protein
MCPERVFGGPRCLSQKIVIPGASRPIVIPESGSGGTCTSTGGGGYGSVPPGTMRPSDYIARYKIPSSSHANGAIVALAELPSTNAMTDVNTYRAAFGIAALPSCPTDGAGHPQPGGTACFARVGQDGTVNTVSSTDCPGWAGEVALDMEMVSAACPDCSIVNVEADPAAFNLPEMNSIAATAVGALAVSNSWGSQEYSGLNDTPLANPSILVVAASGDAAWMNEDDGWGTPSFPASSPHVLAIGGTTVESFGGGTYSEVVWDDDAMGGGGAGGSGCSQVFSMPGYQSATSFNFGACTTNNERAGVDISAAAEFYPSSGYGGIASYCADEGGWVPIVGTSAASPFVAALMVRLGLAGKGMATQGTLFYSNISAFNDVTSGNNDHLGECSDTVECHAGPGYDGPTGLGTPNGTELFALAGGVSPPPPDGGSPPPTDGGGPPPTDGGVPPGKDGSAPPPPGSIGAPCTGTCNPGLTCADPPGSTASVCAPACGSGDPPCPSGFECSGGYCFSAPPSKSGSGKDKGSGGCACSTVTQSSPWAGAAWLALAFLALKRRRRAA